MIVRRPSYFLPISSSTGATILQGPHQSAQKSTRTGLDEPSTSASKFASVTMTAFDIRKRCGSGRLARSHLTSSVGLRLMQELERSERMLMDRPSRTTAGRVDLIPCRERRDVIGG